MEKDILDIELSEEEATKLAEEIQAWKEEYSAKLEVEAEEKVQAKLNELDEENNVWREEVAEAYSDKFLEALDEMREDVRAEVIAESVKTDPGHKVMEEIIKLVAPLIDEEYTENTYLGEIKKLNEKLESYERKEALAEGAAALEELIEGYDDAFKPAIRALIGEGTESEVVEKFEKMISSLSEHNDIDDENDSNLEEDDDDFEFDDEEENEIKFDEEENEDEEVEEEESSELSATLEDSGDVSSTPKKRNALQESITKLI